MRALALGMVFFLAGCGAAPQPQPQSHKIANTGGASLCIARVYPR